MRDPKHAAVDLLQERGHREAARVLERCTISMRHIDRTAQQAEAQPPQAEMLIHAPRELADCVLGGGFPEADWTMQIGRALREVARADDYGLRDIQWVETSPSRPETIIRDRATRTRTSDRTPGRNASHS